MCLCFDLYDTDHNGQISLPEADFMIEDIFGPGWASKEEAREVHAWLHERDDAVLGHPQLDVDAWATFVAANLQIQAPAIHTRLILQTKVFGVVYQVYTGMPYTLGLQPCFGNKLPGNCTVCAQNGTAVLNELKSLQDWTRNKNEPITEDHSK